MNRIKKFFTIDSAFSREAMDLREEMVVAMIDAMAVAHANCRCAVINFRPQVKYWDVKAMPVYPDEPPEAYQIRKWLSQVPHGGMVGDLAALIVYNKAHPELSELIVEGAKNA